MRFLSTYLCIIVLFSKLSFSLDSINQRGEDIGQMIPVFSTLAPMGSTALFITGAGGVVAGAATTSATISGISTSACAIGAVNYNGGNAPIIGNVYVFLEGQEANCKSDIARGVIKFWKRFFLSPKTDDEWKSFKTTVKKNKKAQKNMKKSKKEESLMKESELILSSVQDEFVIEEKA